MDKTESSQQSKPENNHQFPPVVSVLGHVDHGKTTLLDAIRKSSIAAREKGGITQKIGASQIEITHEGKKRWITFIDTPGHEAFANMRSQGVSAADVILLIVAADDGVKPQTRESIQKIQESKLPFIVVFTKSDLETANPEKVKGELAKEGITLEEYGGDTPVVHVSSKTGKNIQELLDLIILVYDVSSIEKDDTADCMGVVIDSKLDKRRGNVSSVVIKKGTLSVGEKMYIPGKELGKIRALFDTNAKSIKLAKPGDAVEILGLEGVLPTGSVVFTKEQAALPEIVQEAVAPRGSHDLAAYFGEKPQNVLRIILKTETSGEFEAIKDALPENVEVVFSDQGDISVSDILMAKDLGALVLGFNVYITKDAEVLAKTEKVFYRLYGIIYELFDEVREALEGLGEEEVAIGEAHILAKFEGNNAQILGIKVTEGKLSLNDKITLYRGDTALGEARISSMKRGKQDVQAASKGVECGIQVTPSLDFSVGDVVLSHK